MSEKIEALILRRLTIIPGLVGIAPIDFEQRGVSLAEHEYANGISVVNKAAGINLSIAIIIEHSIKMNVVATEMHKAIKDILARENIVLISLKIYVRGVQ